MNAVEIEEAISELAEEEFNADEFPFAFLAAFDNKATTIRRLKSGATNSSDVEGGVLQRNNIHLAVCGSGQVSTTLAALRDSPATAKGKAKFVLATDGEQFEAEDLTSGETVACEYADFPDHFGFFLPLARITTVREIRESAVDIKATGRLNRLYVQLLKDNPEWGTEERRHDMNHFMARLIFCFFAEDTDIFNGDDLFTSTVSQMSESASGNTHEIIGELFRAMNTKLEDRAKEDIPRWADVFPYVNGGLFSESLDVPVFSRIARSYLLHIGGLDWKQINPDIFGSMIQAVAEDEERGALGMHYTSVPNILKVLNPLFLDSLRKQLEEAGDNTRKLLNLRNRMAKIRVFDPACGSGNFLVIAYKEMRAIEAIINERRGESGRRTDIRLTNFRGIELRDFPAEIARLALIIAEYQCDIIYRGQKEALAEFLPLNEMNWITCGNALRLDWLNICPPTARGVKLAADDLFHTPLDQAQIDFANEGGETYICGNPPYQGSVNQTSEQKQDKEHVLESRLNSYKDLDYVACWFVKAAEYIAENDAEASLVATNSICQGEQVAMLWPSIYSYSLRIIFAHTSFKWSNNAANNAGVTCVVIGLGRRTTACLIENDLKREVPSLSPYLVPGGETVVRKRSNPISNLPSMITGNLPTDGGNLILSFAERESLLSAYPTIPNSIVRQFIGSSEFLKGKTRYCLWIDDEELELVKEIPELLNRISAVREVRQNSRGSQAKGGIDTPHKFVFSTHRPGLSLAIPKVSSERREYIPCGVFGDETILSDLVRVIYDAEIWNLAVLSSRLHVVWIGTVCGKLKTDFRYSHTLGWNTFPVPKLTEKNKADLTRSAEEILLAREAHYPATMADLYDPDKMPEDLRRAHDQNDEVLERIYIGRQFKNDTERLERLFELYTKMTTTVAQNKSAKSGTRVS